MWLLYLYTLLILLQLLKLADQTVLREILRELGKKENLAALVPDQFGNYVVQTAIVLADAECFKARSSYHQIDR